MKSCWQLVRKKKFSTLYCTECRVCPVHTKCKYIIRESAWDNPVMNRGHELLKFVKLMHDIFEFLTDSGSLCMLINWKLLIQQNWLLIQTKALNETFLSLGLDWIRVLRDRCCHISCLSQLQCSRWTSNIAKSVFYNLRALSGLWQTKQLLAVDKICILDIIISSVFITLLSLCFRLSGFSGSDEFDTYKYIKLWHSIWKIKIH